MAPPTKKRKVRNDTKSSPAIPRNLDFFFGRPTEAAAAAVPTAGDAGQKSGDGLTDEQLARKLQAEWAQEDVGRPLLNGSEGDGTSGKKEHLPDNDADEAGIGELQEPAGITLCRADGAKSGEEASKLEEIPPVASSSSLLFSPKGKTLSLQSAGSAEDTISSTVPFDESPLIFDPSKYVAKLQGHWAAEGGDASYALLTRCFVLINSTQSRIKIVDTLVNLLRVIIEGDPSSLLPTVCTSVYYHTFTRLTWDLCVILHDRRLHSR